MSYSFIVCSFVSSDGSFLGFFLLLSFYKFASVLNTNISMYICIVHVQAEAEHVHVYIYRTIFIFTEEGVQPAGCQEIAAQSGEVTLHCTRTPNSQGREQLLLF